MFTDKEHIKRDENPDAGKILIANPFLKDPNFSRTVILICDHQPEGSFGFIFNRLFSQTLDDLMPGAAMKKTPVHFGGPVQPDTIHFIHTVPQLVDGGVKVLPGIYWGGDFERALELLNMGLIDTDKIKFFIGYSGWGGGQLDNEMKEHSWIVSRATRRLLFEETEANVWTSSLRSKGDEYAAMANYPTDPRLN